jgi:hypothetical protein
MAEDSDETKLKVIDASEILDKIQKGEDIEFDDYSIRGDLYISQINLQNDEKDRRIVASQITFRNCRFKGLLNFIHLNFEKPINFIGSSFEGNADFSGSYYEEDADFTRSSFDGNANFFDSNFKGDANFILSNFKRYANFSRSNFKRYANFSGWIILNMAPQTEESFLGNRFLHQMLDTSWHY